MAKLNSSKSPRSYNAKWAAIGGVSKGVGMIGMGLSGGSKSKSAPMPEHALKASKKRAAKATQAENLASGSFARRAAMARKAMNAK